MKTTIENTTLWLSDAEITHFCGKSLTASLYELPLTILLTGELGAGKTTFLNGFSEALGILDYLPSPTFALENVYETDLGVPLTHIDLYRLENPSDAAAFLHSTDSHSGIRCVEWAQRLSHEFTEPHIRITLADTHTKEGRGVTVSFRDIALPSESDIAMWQQEVALPKHIVAHCAAVAELAVTLGQHLITQGRIIRLTALKRAGLVHDLLRFIDFTPGAAHVEEHGDTPTVWEPYRKTYAGMKHEPACASFLREKGFDALATIVEAHGLLLPPASRRTIEQKLLYYADKRVKLDTVVTLDERFADFRERYGSDTERIKDAEVWLRQARELETELFQDSVPA
ncbi:tRNA (adenosine(37)-N6)-threonylcarbamoyltransferase complex ATPase subunit type 1 TsaE [Candidatus Peregrinibacteria bacterium CG10_big_fil_rev_8_21_14_0_10_49_24]|nr:MAG: tRNA (adenosine(37)-N6)-threonylcarbamoyltransferase complex ATPase subunit type 1 TsaE [Candidatus Peregrinibacteria bacterium CG11_big_fil_rev_8_21_14_0_20_49_14]PIR51021.1 MAG: tRNA (adenosine(37)-N6)-threonylcarbamoyltransferase complex ATPase subunit type 1 TsaE [Candidatus Peregrinibacteria bacterium CG10_big_fil_rev_8_21_14_0_10_49_24]PJA67574.1 MAG: tRNA (adenosine(37)-N6)-threonylcarbamoyltransferase complex ATPase subunit type 1 TsaE [Candidatus Peregrinibacteria bacterium CG_4_